MTDMDMEYGGSPVANDNTQTIALIFYKAAGDESWATDVVHFDRLPIVGEYFAISRDGDWYEVKAVVHMAFPLDYDAEVYAIKVEDKLALRFSFGQ